MRIERRKFISYAIGGAALACTGWKMQDGRMKRIVRQSQALGTTISITVYHHDQAEARKAISNAFKAIERVEQMMSLYRANSQVSRLNRDGSITSPDPPLVRVLKMASDISHRTNGAFDITVQPLWELYSQHASSGSLPSEEEIRKARQSVDWRKVAISECEVAFLSKDTRITLNGIAQGYAADAARSALEKVGIKHALIDSGEIGTHGSKSKEQDWTIGIKHPRQAGELLGCASLEDRNKDIANYYDETSFKAFEALSPRPHFDEPADIERTLQENSDEVWALMQDPKTSTYVSGLSKLEPKLDAAMSEMAGSEEKWQELKAGMIDEGRWSTLFYE